MSNVRKRCFVVMPFSKTTEIHTEEYWTRHYEYFLKPLIEKNGKLEAFRSQPLRGDILSQIITDLARAPLVIANFTDFNPNVFFELGVRLSFSHGTITIAEKGTSIPFDVGTRGVLFYRGDHLFNENFNEEFENAIVDWIKAPKKPDSKVLEVMSGRGSFYSIINREENIRKLKALINEITHNKQVFDHIKTTIQANLELGPAGPKTYTVRRMRSSAVEHLIISRYLDSDMDFYKSTEEYFVRILSINEQLSVWPTMDSSFTDWFQEVENEKWPAFFTVRQNDFERIHQELLSKY